MLVNEFIKRLKTYDPNMELTDEIINQCRTKLTICPYYSEFRDTEVDKYDDKTWVVRAVAFCLATKDREYTECKGNRLNENCLCKEGDKNV